jgi:hypothetical protein
MKGAFGEAHILAEEKICTEIAEQGENFMARIKKVMQVCQVCVARLPVCLSFLLIFPIIGQRGEEWCGSR